VFGLAVALIIGSGGGARAADETAAPTNEELFKELKAMKERIQTLEQQLKQASQAAPAPSAAQPPPAPTPSAAQPAPPSESRPGVVQSPSAPVPSLSAAAPPASEPGSPLIAQPGMRPETGDKAIFGLMDSPVEGVRLGAYGEFKFGSKQNPAANGQWQTGFDAARFVLLPTYRFSDNIIFNMEIEFEHAGAGFDDDDKLHGTAEIEQAWVDFLISPYFNIRSPGIDLVPIGYTNQYHEPTLFYSVNRPEIDNGLGNGLIPTTWASPAASIWGKIVDGLNYQFQVSASLEDFGSGFDARTEGNTVPSGPYAPGIDGINGLDFAPPPRGDFAQLVNNLGYALRLSYTPSFLPGFAGSTSGYFSPNIEPRGAHADDGTPLHHASIGIIDSEFRYRIPSTGLELRGEYAQVFFGSPRNMRANNDGDPTNNVGKTMWGLSGEVAYHIGIGHALGVSWEAVPFYRYTYMNRQTGGFAGTDENAPTGAGQEQFHTVGFALFPGKKLVLKFNYQKVLDRQQGGAKSDSVLGGIGFFF
jgi:hypothetical protein